MRENRTHGSEGGEDGVLLYPYQIQIGADCLCRRRALATKAHRFRLVRLRVQIPIAPPRDQLKKQRQKTIRRTPNSPGQHPGINQKQ